MELDDTRIAGLERSAKWAQSMHSPTVVCSPDVVLALLEMARGERDTTTRLRAALDELARWMMVAEREGDLMALRFAVRPQVSLATWQVLVDAVPESLPDAALGVGAGNPAGDAT